MEPVGDCEDHHDAPGAEVVRDLEKADPRSNEAVSSGHHLG